MKSDKPEHYDNIDNIYEIIWNLLDKGKVDRKSPFHQAYLATYNENYPSIRTIILRNVNYEDKIISFHTDFRSNKINEILKNNNISILFYDHDKKIQIRCSGRGIINNKNENSNQSWQKTMPFSKKCYIVDEPPGSISKIPTSGYKKEHEIDLPNEVILNSGYENFTLVNMEVLEIEWLYLYRYGHRRAKFTINNRNLEKKVWLTP